MQLGLGGFEGYRNPVSPHKKQMLVICAEDHAVTHCESDGGSRNY